MEYQISLLKKYQSLKNKGFDDATIKANIPGMREIKPPEKWEDENHTGKYKWDKTGTKEVPLELESTDDSESS